LFIELPRVESKVGVDKEMPLVNFVKLDQMGKLNVFVSYSYPFAKLYMAIVGEVPYSKL